MSAEGKGNQPVRVSVVMLTYNHEPYIRQAIESVLMQHTTFAYELLVSDDRSSDRTPKIVKELEERYPETIRALVRDRNIGMLPNFVTTLAACRGEYVAFLDGDDYWTSSRKLQAQADFLDTCAAFSMCSHPVRIRYEGDHVRETHWGRRDGRHVLTTEDILVSSLAACSTMFRRRLIPNFPEWFLSARIGDWPLQVFVSEYGPVGYLEDEMATYRTTASGAWNGLSTSQQLAIKVVLYEQLNEHLRFKYDRLIRHLISQYSYRLAVLHAKEGDWTRAHASVVRWVRERPLGFLHTPLIHLRGGLTAWSRRGVRLLRKLRFRSRLRHPARN
jgi:glycosyltransferase involved in cell wall biosynthesis